MDPPDRHMMLYLLGLLLTTFNLLTCVHSQAFPGAGDVWFSLRNETYQNNSCVTLEDIGDGGSDALLCVTNLTACCRPPHGPSKGNWFFPNGTRVPSSGTTMWGFERTRGSMVVRMHRKRGGVNGIYHCEIPDLMNVTQTIYIGVYSAKPCNASIPEETISSQTVGAITTTATVLVCSNTQPTISDRAITISETVPTSCSIEPTTIPTKNGATTTTVPVSHITRPIRSDGAITTTVPVSHITRPIRSDGAITTTVPVSHITRPIRSDGAITTTVPVSHITRPIRSDGAITTTVPVSHITRPIRSDGAITTTVPVSHITRPIRSDGAITTTVPVSHITRPIRSDGAITTTVPVSHITRPIRSDGAITTTVPVSHITRPIRSDGAITTTVPVTSSIPRLNNSPSDEATTTSVIIVVVFVIIIVVVVGVVILVVLFRARKRKQHLETNKLHKVTTENIKIEMKLEQESTTGIEATSSADQPPYEEIQTEASPNIPNMSDEVMEYLNRNSTSAGDYSEIELEGKHALPAKPPRHVSLSDPMPEEKEPNPIYHDTDQHCDPTSTTNVAQENHIYTEPDTTSSQTVDPDSGTYETVYSEPIQPSLFTDAVGIPSDCEDMQPYAPIYTIPTDLPKSEEVILEVLGSNIREINELGIGHFGKVILAETVGLSAKDLRLSESDDDKSKYTLVAVKKLKSGAPNATKEAFEKEVNFMSRLSDRNVIRILGVCYEDTPFIMMEYMEKGDLNHYLQKFEVHSTTDSEPQGQITTSTLVHMATQIASAMKYLASHNFVHRDLATRNCLVGPNYLVKISDFGMSRSLYDSHYYRIHGRFVLPVRWMSLECFYGKFSQKSDVWAFGVTMWEIFTLAKEQPYNDMSDKQVVEDALKGKNRTLLAKPNMCPLEVYKIMLECWAHNSKQRATFEKLFQLLTSDDIDH